MIHRGPVIAFATSAVICIFTSCDGQVNTDGAAGSFNVGGSAAAMGGNMSNSTGASAGNTSGSNGGSSAFDPNTYCGGILIGEVCPQTQPQIMTVTSCDIPLQQSPDTAALSVVLNCNKIVQVFYPDAAVANGYYVNYAQSPPHLELTGSTCAAISTSAANSLAIVQGCPSPP